ncbi:hypothetical protein E2542_SST19331 [Spatholobus suberectus]|nr:hypothetical protein E2542_SST19331 [Spatholobus suberectus]
MISPFDFKRNLRGDKGKGGGGGSVHTSSWSTRTVAGIKSKTSSYNNPHGYLHKIHGVKHKESLFDHDLGKIAVGEGVGAESAFSRYKASSCLSHSCTFFNSCLPSRQVH